MAVIYLAAGNVLPLSQRTDSARPANLKPQTVENWFFVDDDVQYTIRPIHISITQTLSLGQFVNWNPKIYRINQPLGLSQQTSKVPAQSLQDYLTFIQEARTVLYEIVTDVFTLSQSVGMTRGISQLLVFIDSVDIIISHALALIDTIEFTQGVTIRKENNPDFVADPPAPIDTPSNVMYTGAGTTLTLPSPEFDDVNSIQHQRINRRTRAGELIIYKDSLWPVIETITFRFRGLSDIQSKSTLDFLNNTIGQLVTMVDYRGVTWSGVITNPDAGATQDDGHVCPSFSIEIDFEGSRV